LLREITDARAVKEGFRQVYLVTSSYEVLLNEIKQATPFDGHNHPHHQFVYCFKGRFDLTVEGVKYPVKPGDSLVISGEAEHSVDAVSDFWSLDIKYFSGGHDDRFAVRFDVLEEKINNDTLLLETVQLGGMRLRRLTSKRGAALINVNASKDCDYIFIAPGETKIKIDGVEHELQPMTIYRLAGRREFSLLLMNSGYLLALEI